MQARFVHAPRVYQSFVNTVLMYINRENTLDDVIREVRVLLFMPFSFSFLLCDALFNYDFNSSGWFTL